MTHPSQETKRKTAQALEQSLCQARDQKAGRTLQEETLDDMDDPAADTQPTH